MMTAGKTVKCLLRLSSCNGAQLYLSKLVDTFTS